MSVRIQSAVAFKLDLAGVELVATLGTGINEIVGFSIGNVGDEICKVSFHLIDTNASPPLNVVNQFNAYLGWFLRELGPREEGQIFVIPLGPGNRVVAATDTVDTAVIHVCPVIA